MFHSSKLIILCLCISICVISCEIVATNQASKQHREATQQSASFNAINFRPEVQPTETLKRKQAFVQPLMRENGIRVTVNEPRYLKLDGMLAALDRVAYIISKPAAIINALRLVTIAVTSLVMSAFVLPGLGSDSSRRRYRPRTLRHNPFGTITRADLEGMIEFMTKNYDDTLNQAGLNDRSPCRERSICILGDMMANDFPNIIVAIAKFAQNHLPPIDMSKNKYTNAMMIGVNQTDCDQAYKTNLYECPTFRDYVRSYFFGGVKKRRDHHFWWRN